MSHEQRVTLIVFVPVAGAFVIPVANLVSTGLRNILALLLVSASFALSLMLSPFLIGGGTVTVQYAVPLGP